MTSNELRQKFLDFFASKGHAVIPSASLVPANDPTVLFTTAGMHPLVPYLLGEKHPAGTRLVSVQKCIRTGDIDEVGDTTHNTFFEMLGNWSLGDPASPDGIGAKGYFKKEAIAWSFEFLTSASWLKLPMERLAFSCFAGDADAPRDDASAECWRSHGVSKEHIAFLGKDDNWWGPAGTTGPCGPDTEMFYWIDDIASAPKNFQESHSDPRWVEIWNDVFMEYNKTADGTYEPLKQKNVDTGMGLERTLAALNGKQSVYDTDVFMPLPEIIQRDIKKDTKDKERKVRVIADHVRASVFMLADGVRPSNKDRGYVLRRLLRRAMVYAHTLGIAQGKIALFGNGILDQFSQVYDNLASQREVVVVEINAEEAKFGKTLGRGLREFKRLGMVNGKIAFDLYQTYGFPWELTRELAESHGECVDKAEFEAEFKKHQELSRTSSAGVFKGGLADHTDEVVRLHTATHLMNKALREVLGDHVWQKGSNITKERTRFDFTHGEKMADEQKQEVERLVNDWISRDLTVKKEIMPLEEARKLNAIGAFGEKYGETVSVYMIFDEKTGEIISREFCGGPHVEHTGIIGKFKIIKEEASSAGIRRIRARVNQ